MKTVDFSETIEACDLKVGRYKQLIDFMKVASWYHISNHFNNVIICKKSQTRNNNYVIITFCRHNIANDIDLEKSV